MVFNGSCLTLNLLRFEGFLAVGVGVMAEICCGVVGESEASSACEPSSREARRRRMEVRRFSCLASDEENQLKRRRVDAVRDWESAIERRDASAGDQQTLLEDPVAVPSTVDHPKFGAASVCGRRRDMEDMVTVQPSFCRTDQDATASLHYFGVYDGHGCSHVAVRCRDRLHELVKEELVAAEWKEAMERSFSRMDEEVNLWKESVVQGSANCRCNLQTPECDAVGSTAVVSVLTPEKIVVSNCGDSRAVLCRSGKAVPLSSDHKPDRPDELNRIQDAGGRVIYWDGARVLGVLAMSRAIGDNYLKPYVSCEPEVTIVERTPEDECMILASDGLWDVVTNEMACGVARMCLRGNPPPPMETSSPSPENDSDKACSDAAALLVKLALARLSTDNISVVVVDLRRTRSEGGEIKEIN